MKKKLPKIKLTRQEKQLIPQILDYEDNEYNDVAGTFTDEIDVYKSIALNLYDENVELDKKYNKLIKFLDEIYEKISEKITNL